MAYNPISLNVILQAMRKMTVPKPRRATASAHMISAPSGTIMREMTLTFDRENLFRYIYKIRDNYASPTASDVRQVIEQCFCEDVQVFRVTFSCDFSTVDVVLLCSVTAHD